MEQYTILGRIGEGAFGMVFQAKHTEVKEVFLQCRNSKTF